MISRRGFIAGFAAALLLPSVALSEFEKPLYGKSPALECMRELRMQISNAILYGDTGQDPETFTGLAVRIKKG